MKVIDVLGMQITDYPLKEAIKLSLKYVGNGAMNTIFYVSSQVLLDAGENQQQKEWLESMDLILYGEPTVLDVLGENTRERKNEIKQDEFLHEFIKKISRAKQSVYLILDSDEKADSLKRYLQELHGSVNVVGKYIWDEETSTAEDLVNEWIRAGIPVEHDEMKKEEAIAQGAEAMFIEKYGDIVTVYKIGDISLELCGGPHVSNTNELGTFKLKKEESSSSGVRRIKAILN